MSYTTGVKSESHSVTGFESGAAEFRRRDDFMDPVSTSRMDPIARIRATCPEPLFFKARTLVTNAETDIGAGDYVAALAKLREAFFRSSIVVNTLSLMPPDIMKAPGAGSDTGHWVANPQVLSKVLTTMGKTTADIKNIPASEFAGITSSSQYSQEATAGSNQVLTDGVNFYLTVSMPDESGIVDTYKQPVNAAALKVLNAWRTDVPANTAGAPTVPSGAPLFTQTTIFENIPVRIRVTGSGAADGIYSVYGGKTHKAHDAALVGTYMADWPTVDLTGTELTSFLTIYPAGVRILQDGDVVSKIETGETVLFKGGFSRETIMQGQGGEFRSSRLFDVVRRGLQLLRRIPSGTVGYLSALYEIQNAIANISQGIAMKASEIMGFVPPPDKMDFQRYTTLLNIVSGNDVPFGGKVATGHNHMFNLPPVAEIKRGGEMRIPSQSPNTGLDHYHELIVHSGVLGATINTQGAVGNGVDDHVHGVPVPAV